MGIEDGRGKYMKNLKERNREVIVNWFENNSGTMVDCSKETGISYATVRNHVAELRAQQESK